MTGVRITSERIVRPDVPPRTPTDVRTDGRRFHPYPHLFGTDRYAHERKPMTTLNPSADDPFPPRPEDIEADAGYRRCIRCKRWCCPNTSSVSASLYVCMSCRTKEKR